MLQDAAFLCTCATSHVMSGETGEISGRGCRGGRVGQSPYATGKMKLQCATAQEVNPNLQLLD